MVRGIMEPELPPREYVVDPYHISEFNTIIEKVASLKDLDQQISNGIDRLTPKVCNTAVKLAHDNDESPLNRIDQAIALNFADPSIVKEDLSRVIAEKLNLSLAFRYPETFPYQNNHKKELIPRTLPQVKKVGVNIDLAIEALYLQENSENQWNLIVNRKWYELSTDPVYKIEPEVLSPNFSYSTDSGVINICEAFNMDKVRANSLGPINVFDSRCFDVLLDSRNSLIKCKNGDGNYEYEIEWIYG